ncbi:hypothetical protein HK098_003203 [Nowakowskiella sp. JEL0407]|nr:hypothetical protein HK098_003203 [Nowakowskiella sp. JEL0407]
MEPEAPNLSDKLTNYKYAKFHADNDVNILDVDDTINHSVHSDDSFSVDTSMSGSFQLDEETKTALLALNRDLKSNGFRPLPIERVLVGNLSSADVVSIVGTAKKLFEAMNNARETVEETIDRSARISNDNKAITQRVERLKREIMEKDRLIENLRFQLENADRKAREDFGDKRKLELELKRIRSLQLASPSSVQHHHHYIQCEHITSQSRDACKLCKASGKKVAPPTLNTKVKSLQQVKQPLSAPLLETKPPQLYLRSPSPPNKTTVVVNVVLNPDELKENDNKVSKTITSTPLVDNGPGNISLNENSASDIIVEEMRDKISRLESQIAFVTTSPAKRSPSKPRTPAKTPVQKSTSTPFTDRLRASKPSTAPGVVRTSSTSTKNPTPPNQPSKSPLAPTQRQKRNVPTKINTDKPKKDTASSTASSPYDLNEESLETLLEEQSRVFSDKLIKSAPVSPVSSMSTDISFPIPISVSRSNFPTPTSPSQQYVFAMASLDAFESDAGVYQREVLPPPLKAKLKEQIEFVRERWKEVEQERQAVMMAAVNIGKEREELQIAVEKFEEDKRRFRTDRVVEFLDTMI